jgi:tripartite-type tricarboxylate transporter receptor subunit TctC
MITRRAFLSTSMAAVAGAAIRPAAAQSSYPERPIRIVVPYAPGGGSDVLARLVARRMTEQMRSTVMVENRGGAGGAMGLEAVIRSRPDGYTLVLLSTSHASNGAVMHLNYDVVKDTQPVGLIAEGPWILAVNSAVHASDLRAFVELAQQKPGALNYASSGNGSATHLATELFAEKAGISVSHVPYRSSGLALTDLLADRVQFMLASAASVVPYLRDGRLKPLCVSTSARSAILPQIPTAAEAGVPDFNVRLWHGLAAPAGAPIEAVRYLNEGLARVLALPALREQFALEGLEPKASTPDQFGAMVAQDVALWRDIVRTANIKLD